MTLEETGLSEETVMRVRDRPLVESYKVHDVGVTYLVGMLESHGYHVEDHGDDARHADEVFYGDGPDVAVYEDYDEDADEPVNLVCYIEIKTKEIAEWFGRCNLRHYREYCAFATESAVPVLLWFAYLDSDEEVIHRENFVEVEDTDQVHGDVVDVSDQEIVFDIDDVQQTEQDGVVYVAGSDVVGVRGKDTVVDFIPNVHGNHVIELNDDEYRSWPWFCRRF